MRTILLLLLLLTTAACTDEVVAPDGRSTAADVVLISELDTAGAGEITLVSIAPADMSRRILDTAMILARPSAGRMLWSTYRDTAMFLGALDMRSRSIVTQPYSFRLGEYPSLSADGRTVAWNDGYRLLARAPGADPIVLASHMSDHSGPAISPDGRQVAYMEGSQLMLVGIDGTGTRVLVDTLYNDDAPAVWSPDGRRIAAPTTRGVLLIDVRTRAVTRWLDSAYIRGVAWSRDGSRLAVSRSRGTITLLDSLDGRIVGSLAVGSDSPIGLSWSKDDRRILYVAGRDYGMGPVRVVELAGGDVRTLSVAAINAYWSE